MNAKKFLYTVVFCFLVIGLFSMAATAEKHPNDQALWGLIQKYGGKLSFLLPTRVKDIPPDPMNPITLAKINLGKFVFFEPGFSKHGVSCASCHHPANDFRAGQKQSLGQGGISGITNGKSRKLDPHFPIKEADGPQTISPPIFNVVPYQPNLLWSGAAGTTKANAPFPKIFWSNRKDAIAQNAEAMGHEGGVAQARIAFIAHKIEITAAKIESLNLKSYFDKAFPGIPVSKRYSATTAALAIDAYERSVLTTEAPFQRWLRGESAAMDEQMKRGAALFLGKAQCVQCHNGPALAGLGFPNIGIGKFKSDIKLLDDPKNAVQQGRTFATGRPEDKGFKIPTLYNSAGHPLTHAGSRNLRQVIEYKNRGIPDEWAPNLSPLFRPLGLSKSEMDDLEAFIAKGLHDPYLMRYVPEGLPSGNCLINDDRISRMEAGCDSSLLTNLQAVDLSLMAEKAKRTGKYVLLFVHLPDFQPSEDMLMNLAIDLHPIITEEIQTTLYTISPDRDSKQFLNNTSFNQLDQSRDFNHVSQLLGTTLGKAPALILLKPSAVGLSLTDILMGYHTPEEVREWLFEKRAIQ